MRKLTPIAAAVAALGLMTATSAFAGTTIGNFDITATNAQFTTNYVGATAVAGGSISGGVVNAGGSTNPDTGINSSISSYISAMPGNDETVTFGGNQKYFGTLWGSVDPGNMVTLYEGANVVGSFTGAALNSAVGLLEWPATGSYVDFVANSPAGYFNKVVLSSTDGEPFETANFASAAAVPEPASWAMLMLGLFGLGAVLRRRGGALVQA